MSQQRQTPASLMNLPKELVIHISTFLHTIRDLNALSQTNSPLHTLLTMTLYRRNATQSPSSSALHWAAKHNFTNTARLSLAAGADTQAITDEEKTIKGCTPLLIAAYHGCTEVLSLLLQNDDINLNPNARDIKHIRPPISWAVKQRHHPIVRALILDERVDVNLQDRNGDTALLLAANASNWDMVSLLVGSGRADPRIPNRQGATALSIASREREAEKDVDLLFAAHLRLILDEDSSESHVQHVFFYAAIMGQLEIVRYLVEFFGNKLDPNGGTNGYGRGAFSIAADREQVDVVRFLIGWEKTDPNLRDGWLHQSPLFVAVKEGRVDVVDVLVSSERVDLELVDVHGTTPLSEAATRENGDVIRRLVGGDHSDNGGGGGRTRRRPDPNARDQNGETALFKAASLGILENVNALLEAEGIDDSLGNAEGQTPLGIADELGFSLVATRLRA
ncbi:hypothetical protein N7478_001779 [Penicillium angulare]|uniref:uncharacterized protein n=1 Tax=Penicillium angulare TaxID=116970 RepID=UPI0025412AC0|nr:uncharacterized protein N7478_001779 [Penicillium angulare]KAJ5288749.1 hypothetical protein N7478_001779 [Penicillium angulare]